ncbi:MAG TPA: glycosyltransferase [Phycisphaerae bacterium]|nr:glycosyltransferase [Phycisphaerae bacterium]HRY67702.1 glycosyltransferase [Phycisphaerae bacterium]
MIGFVVWCILLVGVACVWASRHLTISRARRDFPPLTEDYPADGNAAMPFLSVLIAAKDEEANIETAVRTMLDQDYPQFELIVINDRSTDRTAEILESLKAEQADGRLKVIHIKELRDGWFGKNNAMQTGMQVARGQWLCFGDADCRQTSRKTLAAAVRFAQANSIDLLSVLPELETHGLWERIIQPVCGAVMVFWFQPGRVNDPRRSEAYANGAFMLMTRRCYDTIGGHEAVRTEVNEDMHMARLTKERSLRLYVIQGGGLYRVRMYTGLRQIWRGWSRIFYGCFGTFRKLLVTMRMLTIMNVFPYASLLIAACVLLMWGWAGAGGGWRAVGCAAALAVIVQQTTIVRFYRISRANPWYAPTFIIGAVMCIGMLISAMRRLQGRGTTTWRGTTYQGQKVVKTS